MCSHVYYMSGDAWKEGVIDATGQHILIYTGNLLSFHSSWCLFSAVLFKKSQILSHVLSFQLHGQDML